MLLSLIFPLLGFKSKEWTKCFIETHETREDWHGESWNFGKLHECADSKKKLYEINVSCRKSYPKTYKTHKKLDPNKEVLYNIYLISALINKKRQTWIMVNVYVLYLLHLHQMNSTLQRNRSRPFSKRFMISQSVKYLKAKFVINIIFFHLQQWFYSCRL